MRFQLPSIFCSLCCEMLFILKLNETACVLQFGILATSTTNYRLTLTFKDNSNVAKTITGMTILKCNKWYRAAFVGRKTQAVPQGITLAHEMLLYLFDDEQKRWRLEVWFPKEFLQPKLMS
jgi:hypothetical protein